MLASVDDTGVHRVGPRDWLRTGDLGGLDEGGDLHIQGRSNQVFKRFGEKISLPALLSCIEPIWSGEAAFYVEHPDGAEPAHVLVLSPVPDRAGLRPVLLALRKGYARTHWPVRIEGVDALPRLENGKLDLEAMRFHPGRTELWRQRL